MSESKIVQGYRRTESLGNPGLENVKYYDFWSLQEPEQHFLIVTTCRFLNHAKFAGLVRIKTPLIKCPQKSGTAPLTSRWHIKGHCLKPDVRFVITFKAGKLHFKVHIK